MRTYRCKCGDFVAWGSMPPSRCSRCTKCGSDAAAGPDYHKEPSPHRLERMPVDVDGGKAFLTRCTWCFQTKAQIEADGEPFEMASDDL